MGDAAIDAGCVLRGPPAGKQYCPQSAITRPLRALCQEGAFFMAAED